MTHILRPRPDAASPYPDGTAIPTGPADRRAAIKAALTLAKFEGFASDRVEANAMPLETYAASVGASLGEIMQPERQVWVVVIEGTGVDRRSPDATQHKYFEAVVDQQTGEFVAVTLRGLDRPPAFELTSDAVPVR